LVVLVIQFSTDLVISLILPIALTRLPIPCPDKATIIFVKKRIEKFIGIILGNGFPLILSK
jgi:hypothetical protein